MADSLGVLLRILLDKSAQKQVEDGIDSIDAKMGKLSQTSTQSTQQMGQGYDALAADFAGFTQKFDDRFKRIQGKLIDTQTGAKATADTLRDFSSIDLSAPAKSQAKLADAAKLSATEIRRAKEEESRLNKEISDLAGIARVTKEDIRDLPQPIYEMGQAALQAKQNFSQVRSEAFQLRRAAGGLSTIGITAAAGGAAIIGTATLASKNYLDFIKQSGIETDALANKWIKASDRMTNAQRNIGEAVTRIVLPSLEKAADIVEKIAGYAQQNPEAVKAILGVGVGLSIFGALALAVSKGIRLYADVKYISATLEYNLATTRFQNSVHEFLAGSRLPGGNVAGAATGSRGIAGVGKTIGTVTLIASAVIIGAEIGAALGNWLGKLIYGEGYKKQGLNDALLTAVRLAETPAALLANKMKSLGGALGKAGEAYGGFISKQDQWLQGMLGVGKATEDTSGAFRDYQKEAEAAAAAAEKAANAQKAIKIVSDLAAANAAAESKYQLDVTNVYRQAGVQRQNAGTKLRDQLDKIDKGLTENLAKMAADFAKSTAKAEADYQDQRAKTVQDGNEQIRKIREDGQKQLIQLEQDHADQLYELGIARDALGIIQENRRYDREKANLEESTNQQAAEARRQTQIKLAEQRQEFLKSQAEARQEYEAKVKEAKAQAEQQRKEAQLAHTQELKEISRQTQEKLSQLRQDFNNERIQRIEAARAQLQDLGVSLTQERQLKVQYYNAMLQDAKGYVEAYRQLLQSGATGGSTTSTKTAPTTYTIVHPLPTKQTGGYGPGYVENPAEFVLTAGTTRALESLIGTRLNQSSILQAVRGQVVWNDQRRFDASLKPEERRLITDDTLSIINAVVGGAA